MKKILFSAASALAIAGVATAADSTEFGVLYVPSTAKETIVAVPWLASGTGSVAVAVADFVLTSGLSAGDELRYYNGGTSYSCWRLNSDKQWVPGNTVTDNGISTAAGAADATLTRGQSIILKRTADTITTGFYIMGKPASTTASALELPAGTMKKPVWALVAPPNVSATDVNTGLTWSNLDSLADLLYIDCDGTMEVLTWDGDESLWKSQTHQTGEGVTIPAGQGAWFCGRGKTTGKSVSWTK